MKEAKDEEYYLLIPNPLTGEKEEFDLERGSNVSLILRLIRKRDKLAETSRENFNKLRKLRKEHNVPSLEDRTQELLEEISSVTQDGYEEEESYNEEISKLETKLVNLKDDYPQEVIDLQNKAGRLIENLDRLGIKIATLILKPVEGVPEEYPSKKDYIEEVIVDDQDIQDIITFFLNTLSSTTTLRRDREIQMKSRSNGEQGKEK